MNKSEVIKFENNVKAAFGRHGYIKCTGIEILSESDQHTIMLTPITSKGELAASCFIEFPRSKVEEFIDALRRVTTNTTANDLIAVQSMDDIVAAPAYSMHVKIGGTIAVGDKKYKCIKHTAGIQAGCKHCAFYNISCHAIACIEDNRADGTDVVFIEQE